MKSRKRVVKSARSQGRVSAVRATISFPSDLYAILEKIARQKRVSLAWIVRAAAEKYAAERTIAGAEARDQP